MSSPKETLDFDLIISIIIPGFSFLFGCSYLEPELAVWFSPPSLAEASFASMIIFGLVTILAGMTVHTVRWITLDKIHGWTGITPRKWDFSKLEDNLAAYDKLTLNHYRFHQFYGGMIVSLLWIAVVRRFDKPALDILDLAIILLCVLFYFGSRDTLHKYYDRMNRILNRA